MRCKFYCSILWNDFFIFHVSLQGMIKDFDRSRGILNRLSLHSGPEFHDVCHARSSQSLHEWQYDCDHGHYCNSPCTPCPHSVLPMLAGIFDDLLHRMYVKPVIWFQKLLLSPKP